VAVPYLINKKNKKWEHEQEQRESTHSYSHLQLHQFNPPPTAAALTIFSPLAAIVSL